LSAEDAAGLGKNGEGREGFQNFGEYKSLKMATWKAEREGRSHYDTSCRKKKYVGRGDE
jgi:hypothetical protein